VYDCGFRGSWKIVQMRVFRELRTLNNIGEEMDCTLKIEE